MNKSQANYGITSPLRRVKRETIVANPSVPGRMTRVFSFFVLVVMTFFITQVVQGQNFAYALALPPPIATLPTGLAGTGLLAGSGEVTAVAATTAEVAAGGAVAVAAAPVAIAAGAVLLTGTALYLGWRWTSSHTGSEYTAPGPGVGTGGCCAFNSTSGIGTTSWSAVITYGAGMNSLYGFSNALKVVGMCGTLYGCGSSQGKSGAALSNSASSTALSSTSGGASLITGLVLIEDGDGAHGGPYNVACAGSCPAHTPITSTSGPVTATTTPKSQCSDGSTVTGSPVTFTGTTTSANLPPILLPACPTGTTRTGAQFPTTAPGVTSPAQPLGNWTSPVIPSAFADCNGTGKICQLNLYRVGHGTGAQQLACDMSGDCAQWQTQTKRTGATRTVLRQSDGASISEISRVWPNGDTAECFWGQYEIEVDGCTTVPTEPNTETGTETKTGSGDCFPSGWGIFNPVEWIYKPVKCALVWAFVPPDGTFNEWQAQISTIRASGPVASVDAITTYTNTTITAAKVDTGCPTNTGPIQWCAIISGAGDWAQSGWGYAVFKIEQLAIAIYFGFYWYNRITASSGSKSEL